jgi:cytochrome b6-f complex iron-sulfur subunit
LLPVLHYVKIVTEKIEGGAIPMTIEENNEKLPINRREFLNFAWLVSLGFFTVTAAGATYLFSLPRFKEGEFGGIVTVGTVEELPTEDDPPDNYPKTKFWLSNTPQGLVALYKVCTHLGCLYNWSNQDVKYICPCHGSQFEKEGQYIQGPAPRNLDQFIVRIETPQGEVLVETDPATGDPIPVPDRSDAIVKIDTGARIIGERHA